MLKAIQNRTRDDKGFTLIELMVVVLIIAILIAIAIPTFLGMRRRAQDRAAQSDLRNAITAAKAFYTDDDTYTGFTAGAAGTAEAAEPSLNWLATGTPPAAQRDITIHVASGNNVHLIARSNSGTMFCIRDAGGNTTFGASTSSPGVMGEVDDNAECNAQSW